MRSAISTAALLTVAATGIASAQDVGITYALDGAPGLLDMPTAQSADEGAIAFTLGYADGLARGVLNFQVTDRLSGSLSFGFLDLYDNPTSTVLTSQFERGFDLRYRLNDETTYLPAVAIGLRDFLTPARLGAEYIVASKSIGDDLTATAGLGWGAMGTRDGFTNPLGGLDPAMEMRPVFDEAIPEGQLASDQWFRGDAALFGGLEYQINDQWGIKAEYSSSAYPERPFQPALNTETPYNLGLTYRPADGVQLGLGYLYGSTIAVQGSFSLNANDRPGMSGFETAPPPINARAGNDRSWDQEAVPESALKFALATLLKREGITLTALAISGDTARVRYNNTRYRSQAQAMGRTARMMTVVIPTAINTFVLEPQARGIALSSTTIARSDLEQLENRPAAAATLFDNATFANPDPAIGAAGMPANSVRFEWGLGPYFALVPAAIGGSVSVDAGLRLRGVYKLKPNLVVAGAIGQSIVNTDADDPIADSTLDIQNVRTDSRFYGNNGVPVLQNLTVAYYGQPARNVFGRVTAGYLERMFGGISMELLWKPVGSRLGIGAEVNYAAQRNTDMFFGFDEYDFDTVTGYLSTYYDLGNGYHTQLDLGRYLAGDWGGTISVDREFDNGIRVGVFVSHTDMTAKEFGDGSYNKGVRITIPQDFLTGQPTQSSLDATLRTRIGDGGARLAMEGRLYDVVRGAHVADLGDTWGRFWR